MAQRTAIQWADATWNPWRGCHKISPGCKNCYMFRDAGSPRNKKLFPDGANKIYRSKTTFRDPLKWKEPLKIFVCSWSDFFIDKADAWRAEAWDIIINSPQHTFLLCTKRPENIPSRLPYDWGKGYPNVWLGVSAENQFYLNNRGSILLSIPAAIHWVSMEPLLGPIDLIILNDRLIGTRLFGGIDWIVTGGESDRRYPRPCNPEWLRILRDQCRDARIAFFHKQNGGKSKIGGAWGGRLLDGVEHNEFPE